VVNSGRVVGLVRCCSLNRWLVGEQMGLSRAASGGVEQRWAAPSSVFPSANVYVCAGQWLAGTTFTQESSTNGVEQH